MAFFRKWKKTHYKHTKFTEDPNETEDWKMEKNIKNALNAENIKQNLSGLVADDEEDDNHALFATYEIKYLGCTPIETKRSEKVISEAIKIVIANSKAGGRKNKTQKRVKLNVSQEGIEVLDAQTLDTLMRFSIYKISYCSVDAAHDHAFTFVGSEIDPLSEQEKMSCHVFHCQKRKIAHEITLMLARCFEGAYQQWRDMVVQHDVRLSKNHSVNNNNNNNNSIINDAKNILKEQNGNATQLQSKAEVHQNLLDDNKSDNLLIDLAANNNDVRKYMQNTWVSFEDDNVLIAA